MFCVGDFVFAKMRGFPPWPAVVERVIKEKSGSTIKQIFEVYFFGTHQIGSVREIDLFPYEENLETFRYGSKRNTFCVALKEIEDEISACYKTSGTSNSVIQVKDCTVVLERTLLEKKSQMNIPGDHTSIIDDNVHLLHSSVNNKAETQDCSDIEYNCIESPKRLFYNGKFQDSGNNCTIIGEESHNLECRSSTVRENSTNCPSQPAVRCLFQEKPEQQIQENILFASSPASDSRQSSTVITCRVSPILFIESDEADSSEKMTTNAQGHSHNSSQKPVLKEENMPEVELLSEIHGPKRGQEYRDAGFHDLPTPPRLDPISIPCDKMFDNCVARKSLEGLLDTPNICDISTPKRPSSASKLRSKPLENSYSKIPGTELEEDGQKLKDFKFHDLPTPKCDNDSVKSKDYFKDTCPPSPVVSVEESKKLPEFGLEKPVKENAKTSNSRTNCTRKTEVIRNGVVHIITNDNLTQIGQCSISRFDGSSSNESEGHSTGQRKSVLVLGCGKNGLTLSNFSTEQRKKSCERRSNIFQESGNFLARSSLGSDGNLNRNSEPLEIDLVSDSSDEEKPSPCPKRIEYDSQITDSVSNDREALLASSRARWKARNKIHTSVMSTESSVTDQSHDLRKLESDRSSQSVSVLDPGTAKETSPIGRVAKYHARNSEQDKYNDESSTLHESIDIHPSIPIFEDRPSLKPAALNKDPLLSGCSRKSENISLRDSKFGASESQIPTPKENTSVHQSKQMLPSEKFSPVFNQENILIPVLTTDKERCVTKCVSPQLDIVSGHLNEISHANSGARFTSMPVSFQSCDMSVRENDITLTVHDCVTHSVSDLRLPKRQLGLKSSSVEASVPLCNSTVSEKCEKDRPVLSKTPKQVESSLCSSVNLPNVSNEISPVFGVDSSVLSCYPTNPENSQSEMINNFPENKDSALYSMEYLTPPKMKIPSHLSAKGVPSHRLSRDVSLTIDQSSLTPVPCQFSELSPTHQQTELSNSSSTTETSIGINSSGVDTRNSVVRQDSAPLSGARNLQPSKDKKEHNVATKFSGEDDYHIDSTYQSRNESADKGLKRTSASSNDAISSKYFKVLKRSPVVILHRMNVANIQSLLKSVYSSSNQDSENLTDGSKKRKTCPPKKLHSVEKYSNSGSSNDMKTPDKPPTSEMDESGVTCGTLNAVSVRPQVSDAKTNQQLLRRKMFSLAWRDHREDLLTLKSNGLLMAHQKQIAKGTNTPGERKNIPPNEATTKEDRNFTENTKCKQIYENGKRGFKRCDVCWRNVENVTEHIINDHRDMFYSKNNL